MNCNKPILICGSIQIVALLALVVLLLFLFDPNVVYEPHARTDYVRRDCTVLESLRRHVDAECWIAVVQLDNDVALCGVAFGPEAINDEYDLDDTLQSRNDNASNYVCYVPPNAAPCATESIDSACECCNAGYAVLASRAEVLADSLHHRKIIRRELGCADVAINVAFICAFGLSGAAIACVLWRLCRCKRRILRGKRFEELDDAAEEMTFDDEFK